MVAFRRRPTRRPFSATFPMIGTASSYTVVDFRDPPRYPKQAVHVQHVSGRSRKVLMVRPDEGGIRDENCDRRNEEC